jgi:hypothetical protein
MPAPAGGGAAQVPSELTDLAAAADMKWGNSWWHSNPEGYKKTFTGAAATAAQGSCKEQAIEFAQSAAIRGYDTGLVVIGGTIKGEKAGHAIAYAKQGGQMYYVTYGRVYTSFGDAVAATPFEKVPWSVWGVHRPLPYAQSFGWVSDGITPRF